MKGSKLHGVFICLRSGIAKKKLVILFPGNLSQFIGELLLQRNPYRVGIKRYLVQLMRDPGNKMRVSMTDRNHGMAAIHVEVLPAPVVPEIRSLGACDRDIVYRIYVEEFHNFYFRKVQA